MRRLGQILQIRGLAGRHVLGFLPVLACAALLFGRLGGRGACALLLAVAVFTLPGFALLGRPGSAVGAWLRGLAGVALSSAGIIVAGALGFEFRPRTWLASAVLATGIAWAIRYFSAKSGSARPEPVEVSVRDSHDALARACVVGFVLLLAAPAWFAAGRSLEGAHHFGAFFCADLFKHAAYAGSLAAGPLPPLDPFSAGDSLRYYWLSYVVPAAALQIGGAPLRAFDLLLGQTLLQTVALATLLFGLARRLKASPSAAAPATILGFASLNLDGLAAILAAQHLDLNELVQARNLEALDLTLLLGAPDYFAASSLYRLCLYVPQHQLGLLLLLAWAHVSLRADAHTAPARAARIAMAAVLPCISLLLAPAAFAVIAVARVGLFFADDRAPRGRARAELVRDGLAFVAAAALLWAGEVLGAAGDMRPAQELLRDYRGPATRFLWLVPQLVTSFGGLLVLGLFGALRSFARPSEQGLARWLPLALVAGGLGSLVLAEVFLPRSSLRVDVELKASFVSWVALVLGSALIFQELHRPSPSVRNAIVAAALLFGLGLPSLVGDVLWHWQWPRDRALRQRWEVAVPADDMAALDWARENVPSGARFVQQPSPSFLEYGVDAWVPVFAGRAVVVAPRAGVRRELRLEQARRLFQAAEAREVSRLARELGAEYVYASQALNPLEYEGLVRVLGSDERAFRRVYAGARAGIWQVL